MKTEQIILSCARHGQVKPNIRWHEYKSQEMQKAHLGAYCPKCNKFIKWLKQEPPHLDLAPASKWKDKALTEWMDRQASISNFDDHIALDKFSEFDPTQYAIVSVGNALWAIKQHGKEMYRGDRQNISDWLDLKEKMNKMPPNTPGWVRRLLWKLFS